MIEAVDVEASGTNQLIGVSMPTVSATADSVGDWLTELGSATTVNCQNKRKPIMKSVSFVCGVQAT